MWIVVINLTLIRSSRTLSISERMVFSTPRKGRQISGSTIKNKKDFLDCDLGVELASLYDLLIRGQPAAYV